MGLGPELLVGLGPVSNQDCRRSFSQQGDRVDQAGLRRQANYLGGFNSKHIVSVSAGDQSRAVSVQQVVSTDSQLVSSIPPALMNTIPGISSTKVNIWLPQLGQNPRLTWEPFETSRRIGFIFALDVHGIKREQDDSRFSGARHPLAVLAVTMQAKTHLGFVKFVLYLLTQTVAFLHCSSPLTVNHPPTLSVSRRVGNGRDGVS